MQNGNTINVSQSSSFLFFRFAHILVTNIRVRCEKQNSW